MIISIHYHLINTKFEKNSPRFSQKHQHAQAHPINNKRPSISPSILIQTHAHTFPGYNHKRSADSLSIGLFIAKNLPEEEASGSYRRRENSLRAAGTAALRGGAVLHTHIYISLLLLLPAHVWLYTVHSRFITIRAAAVYLLFPWPRLLPFSFAAVFCMCVYIGIVRERDISPRPVFDCI